MANAAFHKRREERKKMRSKTDKFSCRFFVQMKMMMTEKT